MVIGASPSWVIVDRSSLLPNASVVSPMHSWSAYRRRPRARPPGHHRERHASAALDLCRSISHRPRYSAAQNLVTIGVVRALRSAGRHLDTALVGFDDVPMSDLLDPPITVLAQDPTAIGRQAASTLFARLDGDRSPTQTYIVPTTLIIRGSGEIPSAVVDRASERLTAPAPIRGGRGQTLRGAGIGGGGSVEGGVVTDGA